jgi:hypothetical protein
MTHDEDLAAVSRVANRMYEIATSKGFHECDKATSDRLTCAEEELADIIIRAMDTAVALGVDIGRAIEIKSRYNESRAYRHGGKAA